MIINSIKTTQMKHFTVLCIQRKIYRSLHNFINNNHFDISVKTGINNILETDVQFIPSPTEQRMFDKLNNAFDLNEDNNDVDSPINCNYSIDEFVSAKLKQSKYFSTFHLNILQYVVISNLNSNIARLLC